MSKYLIVRQAMLHSGYREVVPGECPFLEVPGTGQESRWGLLEAPAHVTRAIGKGTNHVNTTCQSM